MHQLILPIFHQLSPLFFPLLALIGIICARVYVVANPLAICGIGILAAGTIVALSAKNNHIKYLIFVTTVIVTLGWVRTNTLLNYYTQFPFDQTSSPCHIEGTVTNSSYSPAARMKHSLLVNLETVNNKPVPNYTVQLYTLKYPPVAVGDTISVDNITIKTIKNSDFQWYLIKEGIAGSSFTDKAVFTVEKHPEFSIIRALFELRSKIFKTFKSSLSKPAFALFSSLFLGERATSKYTLEKVQRQCKNWGISHYLARSGLHLVMVFSAYEMILRFLPVPYMAKQLILLLLGILYYLLSWPSVSFIRAFVVFLFYKACIFIFRPIHFTHILLLTCIVILLANPFQLFFLDFQLSFLLTFALGWLNLFKNSPKRAK